MISLIQHLRSTTNAIFDSGLEMSDCNLSFGLVSTLDYARFSQPYFGSLLEERSLCLISDFVDSFIVVDGLLKNWWIQCCFQNRLILSDLTMPIPPLDKK